MSSRDAADTCVLAVIPLMTGFVPARLEAMNAFRRISGNGHFEDESKNTFRWR